MEKISKNCYKGEVITSPADIVRLAKERRSIYASCMWGLRPAAVIMMMQYAIVMKMIMEEKLFFVVKANNEK